VDVGFALGTPSLPNNGESEFSVWTSPPTAALCNLQNLSCRNIQPALGSNRPDSYTALLNCLQILKLPLQTALEFNVGTVPMYGFGGRHGGQIMPRVQLPAVTSKRKTWNKGRIIGRNAPYPRRISGGALVIGAAQGD
jgi:hypothetical protein